MTIHAERIPSTDPRLGRHIMHDDRSKAYRFDTTGLILQSVRHTRRVPIFNQGAVGSCTSDAGIGCLGTDPYYDTLRSNIAGQVGPVTTGVYPLDEAGVLALYSAAETIDGDGPYPPNDNGSTGLSVAQALKNAGEISGYQHTFSLDDALKALTVTPFITGITWYNSMFTSDPTGRVQPDGRTGIAGGHEIVADELVVEREEIWFTNSWGSGWGVNGRFWMSFADYGTLLGMQGDVTIFTPLNQPAPIPTPVPVPPAPAADPDAVLAAAAHPWVAEYHIGHNERMAVALKVWLAAKGL